MKSFCMKTRLNTEIVARSKFSFSKPLDTNEKYHKFSPFFSLYGMLLVEKFMDDFKRVVYRVMILNVEKN